MKPLPESLVGHSEDHPRDLIPNLPEFGEPNLSGLGIWERRRPPSRLHHL